MSSFALFANSFFSAFFFSKNKSTQMSTNNNPPKEPQQNSKPNKKSVSAVQKNTKGKTKKPDVGDKDSEYAEQVFETLDNSDKDEDKIN